MQFEKSQSMSPIQCFYANQIILITGGTGFLGKLLIEKLLRSCPELKCIYVIVRRKKDQNVQNRMQKMFEEPIFNYLKQEFPHYLQKVIPIEGDCSLPNLGLSEENKFNLLNNVSIVFHVAATIRFTETLKKSIADNVFGTKELIALCKSMTNLKAAIHVSTFYAHCIRSEVDERFYKLPITAERILKMADALNTVELEKLVDTLRKDYPNNYCFTKAIAEELIEKDARDLPIGVFRPSIDSERYKNTNAYFSKNKIVQSTYHEPIPGWIDNYSGPNAMLLPSMLGLLKAIVCDKTNKAEIVPADLTINALITSAWDVALNKTTKDEPFIYNYICTSSKSITWEEFFNLTRKYEIPSINSWGSYSLVFYKHYWMYKITQSVFLTAPAFFMDMVSTILGKKIWAMKTEKKIDAVVNALTYFSMNSWTGEDERIKSLWKRTSAADKIIFPFSMENFDWHEYTQKYMIGLRVYLLKDPLETVKRAKIRRIRLLRVYKILTYTLMAFSILTSYKLLKKTIIKIQAQKVFPIRNVYKK